MQMVEIEVLYIVDTVDEVLTISLAPEVTVLVTGQVVRVVWTLICLVSIKKSLHMRFLTSR